VRAGHDVRLAFGPIYGPEGTLLPEAAAGGVQTVQVRWMRRAVLPVHDYLCYRSLRRLIREFQPHVVHTHSSKAGILGRAAAWAERVPAVIHTIHGLPFHDRQSRLVHHGYVLSERWAARRCHKLVGITAAMCRIFQDKGIGRPDQFTVVPSGVEVEAFARCDVPSGVTRQRYGIPQDAPVVGLVARLDPLKGHEDLLDVLPALMDRHPGVRLMFVGDGWHRAVVEKQVKDAGWTDRVIFTGLVPQEQVPSLLRAMDIMALPSYQEGQGRTLVEALLCGCAVVGYDAGGIGEVCVDGKTGRLVPIGDRAALAGAIMDLLDHPQERHRLAAQGQAHVQQHFSAELMYRRLEEIYREVLGAAGNGTRAVT
jgi:glycosyltransferase involved in cell wall biosynthesis